MKKLNEKQDAVVGIVAAFLIVGLIVSVISVFQSVYVPKWMEEREAEHMTQVADQFANLKYSIDTHVKNQVTKTPISNTFTLGSKEMPFLLSARAFGSLEIIPDHCEITITHMDPITTNTVIETFKIGTIKYSSINAYYLNQIYAYEAGSIILSQHNGDTMYIKPFLTARLQQNIDIDFTIADIEVVGGKSSVTGFGTYPIFTEFKEESHDSTKLNVEKIEIKTDYTNTWSTYFDDMLSNAGLNSGDYSITKDDEKVEVGFTIPCNIDLYIVTINAQVAIGFVDTT